MLVSADYSRLLAEGTVGLAAYMKSFVATAANDETGSFDHYMCTLALFNACAYAGQRAAAADVLQILEAIDIVEMKRMPETTSFDLTTMEDFGRACQLVKTAIIVIDGITVECDDRTRHRVAVYATKLYLLAANDINNPEIPELLVIIRNLSRGSKYYNAALIAAFELLLPAGILATKDAYTLYSLWTFMKVDERFYGNHYPDDLAKVDAWIRQLYPPPHKFIFESRC